MKKVQKEKSMKRKKLVALALVGVMALSLAACGNKEEKSSTKSETKTEGTTAKAEDGYLIKASNQDAKSKDNDLVIAIEGSVSSLDPANIPDTNAISATRGIYDTLVKFNRDLELEGSLAEKWEISDDSLTYTFHLRKDVKFHDGTDFNAQAIVSNYERIIDKENNLRQRRTYIVTNADGSEKNRIESIETPDDYTVVYKLTEAWAPFINRLTQFCVISPKALEEHGNAIMNNPVGTGAFKFQEWEEGDHTTMVKNEDYWGEVPSVDSVTIREVPEAGSRTAMLQTGEADFIYPIPSDQIAAVEGSDDINVHIDDSNIMRYVTLNMNLPELSDVKVRQAMNYAIDKEAYVQVMYNGNAKVATSLVPSIIHGYQEQEAYTYDLEKAKELMKEAGYEDGFKLTLWGDNTSQEIKGMTFVKQQLEQINIDVEVLPMEPATVSDKIYVDKDEAEINMWYVNWSASDFTMDGSLRSLLYSTMVPPTSANTAYYENPEFDALLDDGLHTADESEQKDYYAKAQKMAWEAAPWLFLENDEVLYSTKSYVSDVYVLPDGAFTFSEAKLAQ